MGIASGGEKALKGSACGSIERYQPLAAAFSGDGQHPPVAGQDRAWQGYELAAAPTGGIERLDQGVQAQRAHARAPLGRRSEAARALQQAIDLGDRKRLR